MAKRIPALPPYWEQFLLCVLFHLALPLLPIGIEIWQKRSITDSSLAMGTAMYAISIGGSSRSRLMFGLMVATSIVYSVVFGVLGSQEIRVPPSLSFNSFANAYAGWALVAIFVIHALERYNRHVVDRAPYWEF